MFYGRGPIQAYHLDMPPFTLACHHAVRFYAHAMLARMARVKKTKKARQNTSVNAIMVTMQTQFSTHSVDEAMAIEAIFISMWISQQTLKGAYFKPQLSANEGYEKG